jgi:hypothetical protein
MAKTKSSIPIERIAAKIDAILGQTVLFDAALATLYGVEIRTLVPAVSVGWRASAAEGVRLGRTPVQGKC